MNIKRESLKDALVSRGLNASYQRVRILGNLIERRDHPTVGMVYDALSGEMPTLARATVYNTLNALVEKGLVTALTIKPEEARYDYKREPHHHFLCKRCGSILDIEVRCAYADVAEVEGHRVEDVHGYFKGICRHCLRQERDAGARSRKPSQRHLSRKGG
ncbi:MAG TPA: transcriptional repressor [Syntrophorhabdales bacterium]|nr:transcriptional repressor [Syntrophorhabdales bacterium]